MVLQGHTYVVERVAVTNDDKYVVSGFWDKTIRIWNLLEKRLEAVLQRHWGWVITLAFISNNKYIVSASYNKNIKSFK